MSATGVFKLPMLLGLIGMLLAGLRAGAAEAASVRPSVSVADVTVREGTGGEVLAVFTVTSVPPPTSPLTVGFQTASGSALAGIDFQPRQGTVLIPPDTGIGTVTIPLVTDQLAEGVETFEVLLQPHPDFDLARGRAVATILDDDIPVVAAERVVVLEGSEAERAVRIPLTLSIPSAIPVRVRVDVSPDTAESPSDFAATNGVVVFPAGSQWQTFTFHLRGDEIAEFEERILVRLSEPVNASIVVTDSEVVVLDDDPIPTVSISGETIPEPTGTTATLTFRVRLSGPSTQPVRVSYSTRNGTASSGVDYLARLGTLVISPGDTEAVLPVTVLGDALAEEDETFSMVLRNPINAILERSSALGILRDDDRPLAIRVQDASTPEGAASEPQRLTFEVLLSAPPTNTVVVNYATRPLTALPGSDYLTTTGILTFVAIGSGLGNTRHLIHVPVVGDDVAEPNETLELHLSHPENAVLGRADALGSILNDDGATLSVEDTTVPEGDTGTSTALLVVNRRGPTADTVTVSYRTQVQTASPDSDFIPRSGLVTFLPGETRATIPVQIHGDDLDEDNETFGVELFDPRGATLLRAAATATIVDDDLPGLWVEPVTVLEVGAGSAFARFVVRLDSVPSQEVSVDFHIEPRTATAGQDYLPLEGRLTFPPGITDRTISVPILNDAFDETDETFALVLSNPSLADIPSPETLATIVDDDPAPFVTLEDAQTRECTGPDAAATLEFPMRLSVASGRRVEVPYQTRPVTAQAESDYLSVTNVAVFAPGEALQWVRVPVVCDTDIEPDEVLEVLLGAPQNAVLSRARARGRILNDDLALPTLSLADQEWMEGAAPPGGPGVELRLSTPSTVPVAVTVRTLADTARPGSDYQALDQVVTLQPGTLSTNLPLLVIDDDHPEGTEVFFLELSSPVNALLGQATARVTLRDDDPPRLRVLDASVVVSTTDPTQAEVSVLIEPQAFEPIEVGYTTHDDTAQAPGDYVSTEGILRFLPGETRQTVTIPVAPNSAGEAEEGFWVQLTPPTNAVVDVSRARITLVPEPIPNRPPTVVLQVPETADQGSAGQPIVLRAEVSDPENAVAQVAFLAQDNPLGTATNAPFQFTWTPASPGVFTLTARAEDAQGLSATSAPVTIRILAPARIQASNLTVAESAGTASLPLTLSRPAREPVSLRASTRDDTATAGTDYLATDTRIVFAPGETTQTIPLTLLNDRDAEPDETFHLELTAADNAVIDTPRLTIQITDDDLPPPTNTPPVVRIVAPAHLDVFPATQMLRIDVDAQDTEAPVARVEFFIDDQSMGSDLRAPFSLTWQRWTPGDHVLRARAWDAAGAFTDSTPVRIALTESCGKAAIVANVPDPELAILRTAFFELGIPSTLIARTNATADGLSSFDLIVWHDGGQRGLSARDVALLQTLANAGKPLYFIGDQLVESGADLDASVQAEWIRLVRLRPGPAAPPDTWVRIVPTEPPPQVRAIVQGGVSGDVSDFEYPFSGTTGTRPEPDNDVVLAQAGSREVLVALPEDEAGQTGRRVSQAFRVLANGNASSQAERLRLFRNAVVWLMRCTACPNVNLTPIVTTEPAPAPNTGSTQLTIVVHASGACEALGVSLTCQLPETLRFTQATTSQGVWNLSPDGTHVTFVLGRLRTGDDATLRILAQPTRPGPGTARIRLASLNEVAGALDDNETNITLGSNPFPSLSVQSRAPGVVNLRIDGAQGVPLTLETSLSPAGPWTDARTVMLTPETPVALLPIETSPLPHFFRVRTP